MEHRIFNLKNADACNGCNTMKGGTIIRSDYDMIVLNSDFSNHLVITENKLEKVKIESHRVLLIESIDFKELKKQDAEFTHTFKPKFKTYDIEIPLDKLKKGIQSLRVVLFIKLELMERVELVHHYQINLM